MQLRFLRFTLIISLLTSNEAKLKTKSGKTSPENKEMNFEFSKSLQHLTSLKNKYSNREINFPKFRHGRTTHIKAILSNPKLSATQMLAEKLAKEALESPKMQKEFKKLTIIKSKKRNSRDIRKNPKRRESVIRSIKATKGYYKPVFKGPKRKKRKKGKKHKCIFGSFKTVPLKIREEAICKPEARNPSLEINKALDDSRLTRKTRKAIARESMLERVMQTTTRDPNKKNPGDQGMEYSEYYNDDDVVNDPIEKIQKKDDDFKSSITRFEREITDKKTNIPETLQKGLVSLNQDDEFEDDVENEDVNESDVLLSETGQSRHKNQVYQQNLINQQREPIQRNQIYPNIYQQNPYVLSDPEKYRKVQQQIGVLPNPQFLFQNQYRSQFQNHNQVLSPVSDLLNQSKKKVLMKNNQNFKGNNYKRNQVLVPVEEPQQLYPGIEMTSLNSTIFGSTTVGSSAASCYTNNQILNNLTPLSQNSGHLFGIPGTENSKKRLDETLAMKYNLKPMNSLVPFFKGHVVERQNQQLNSTVSKEDTQVIANEILNKIVDELEELKADRSKKSQKEGKPCRLSGSWNSTQAGVKLNMKVVNYTIAVNIEKLEPLPSHEGLLNTSWNLSGQVPFRHGGPFSLIGVNNKTKSLAVFSGSCRICQGVDTIEGIWTVSREPHDCRDFQMATGIYNDIFRRIKLHNDKRKKEKSSTESSTILNSTTNKS